MKRRDPLLAQASAYWRLARKAEINGQRKLAQQHTATADRIYRRYLRKQQSK